MKGQSSRSLAPSISPPPGEEGGNYIVIKRDARARARDTPIVASIVATACMNVHERFKVQGRWRRPSPLARGRKEVRVAHARASHPRARAQATGAPAFRHAPFCAYAWRARKPFCAHAWRARHAWAPATGAPARAPARAMHLKGHARAFKGTYYIPKVKTSELYVCTYMTLFLPTKLKCF